MTVTETLYRHSGDKDESTVIGKRRVETRTFEFLAEREASVFADKCVAGQWARTKITAKK